MRLAVLLLCAAALSGCAVAAVGPAAGVATQATRAAAKATVTKVASERFPGVPVTPISDCVIDNASVTEILTMARAAAAATPSPQAVDTIVGVIGRPDTIQCLRDEGLPRLLAATR